MQQHRIISLLSILLMLIIPVMAWFLVAQPQLAAATLADQQRADMDAQNRASADVVAQLKADSARLPELNDDLNTLRTSIPADVDSSGYIDGLDALARIAAVSISSLTVDTPVVYVPAQGEDEAAQEDEAAPADEDALPPAVVTDPLISGENFVAIPVTITVAGGWDGILRFVDGLQSSPRLFLVTGLSTSSPDDASGQVTGSISGYIYAIPTGVEGKPKPISTTVKQMGAPADDGETADDADAADDGEPDPDPTDTPAP